MAEQREHTVRLSRVLQVARKQLKFLPERKMEENLEHACGDDLCEAFRMGAWEAQREIISRLSALAPPVNVLTTPAPLADETKTLQK